MVPTHHHHPHHHPRRQCQSSLRGKQIREKHVFMFFERLGFLLDLWGFVVVVVIVIVVVYVVYVIHYT